MNKILSKNMVEIKWSEYCICSGTIPKILSGYFN